MPALPPILHAALAGFITALLFSAIPVGPINLTILNEGSQRGFRWAMFIGLGASAMELIYCSIAFTGFSSFFAIRTVKAVMELFTFVFLLFHRREISLGADGERADETGRRLAENRGAPRRKITSALGVHDRLRARDGQPRRFARLDCAGRERHGARLV